MNTLDGCLDLDKPLLPVSHARPKLNHLASEYSIDTSHVHTGGYELIFAIRLPSAVKEKEQDAFQKVLEKIAKEKKKHEKDWSLKNLLKEMLGDDCKGKAEINLEDESLRGALNCMLGLIYSFFETLAASNDAPVELVKFASVERNKIFICTRMSKRLAETLADMAEYPVQLSAEGVESLDILIEDPTGLVPAFIKFDMKHKKLLREHYHPVDQTDYHCLHHIDRVRVLYDKMSDHLHVRAMTELFESIGVTFKVFPAHDVNVVEGLQKDWANLSCIFHVSQPIDEIRNYFGRGTAFYFLLLGAIRKGFFPLILVAVVVDVCRHFEVFGEAPRIFFCFFVMAWFTVWLKYWRRLQNYFANKWGADYKTSAVKPLLNPHFNGHEQPIDIDQNIKRILPDATKKRWGTVFSYTTTGIMMSATLVLVASQRMAASAGPHDHANVAHAARMLAVQIKIFDILWHNMGEYITACEQHPYQRTYDHSFAVKYFAFCFINTFNGFCWVAFLAPSLDPKSCDMYPGGCNEVLRHTTVAAFPVMILFIGVQMLVPWLRIRYKMWKQKGDMKKAHDKNPHLDPFDISSFEQQNKMYNYGGIDETCDYMQVITLIAFMCLFGVVDPTKIALLTYFALSIHHRVDAIRLCVLYQRVHPSIAQSIGVWDPILKFVNYASVLILSALIVRMHGDCIIQFFPALIKLTETGNTWAAYLILFLVIIIGSFLAVWFYDLAVPDVDAVTAREKQRQAHQRSMLFEKDEGEFNEHVQLKGHSRWKESKFDEVDQLTPEDEKWHKPISFSQSLSARFSPFSSS